MENGLDVVALKRMVGRDRGRFIDEKWCERLMDSVSGSEIEEGFKERFYGWVDCLRGSGMSLDDYVGAVKFVSWKLVGLNDFKAWVATFPDRYSRYMLDGRGEKYISAVVAMYVKGKLVVELMRRSIVPSYVLNAPYFQEAINTLVGMIRDEKIKGMAKVKACETLLNYTKQPEVIESNIKIDVGQNETIDALREVSDKMAETLSKMLERGGKLEDVARRCITIDAGDDEFEESE